MAPQGVLVFKLEQVLCNPNPDYSELHELIRKEELSAGTAPKLLSVGERLVALKKVMAPKAYRQFRKEAESAAEKAEAQSLLEAPIFSGVTPALEAAHGAGWQVAVASDFARASVRKSLEQKSLSKVVDLVAARVRLDEDRRLEKRLSPVKRRVRSLEKVVYFCNRSREVKEAKALGMRCMVLPSKAESFRTLLWAEPDGMILSMQELPQLLDLPSMKLSGPGEPAVAGGAEAGAVAAALKEKAGEDADSGMS